VYGLHVTTGATGVRVEHNAFLQFDHPLLFELADQSLHTAIDIDSNLFDGGSLFPKIHFTGPGNVHRITIANNHIVVIGDHGPNQTGIQVEISQGTLPNRTFHHAVITGNVLDGSPGESFGRGIVLNPTAVGGCHDVLVSGNAFSNLATGIEIGPNCRRIFLSENAFEAATVTTPIVNNDLEPRGAFFPDRLGVGRVNAVTEAGLSKAKEIYAFSSQAGRPRVYLQGAPGVSTPGVEFAFDSTNTRRAAIVGRDVGAGVQLELFTKPNGSGGATQRIVLDPDGNLVWTSSGYAEMMEAGAEPPAPAADRARLFLRDQGGKTQLCVRFATGAVQVLATQP
jgi:hypothetical protein